MTKIEANELLQETARKLAEHFDAVQILASWKPYEGGDWSMEYNGCGNWYARRGMMQEVLQSDEAIVQAQRYREADKPEDE